MMALRGNKCFLADSFGNAASFTLHNAMRVSETHRIAGGVFNDNLLDPNYATSVAANGSITVSDGEAVVSGTATDISIGYE